MRTNLRVGAIIFFNGKLVTTIMRKKDEIYHVLPGGGVESNETINEAIKREVKEELNIKIKKIKLVYIRELNLKNGENKRGIEFYFAVEDYSGKPTKGFNPEKKESSFEEVGFLDLEELEKVSFHPKQLIKFIKSDKENNFNKFKHLGLYDYP